MRMNIDLSINGFAFLDSNRLRRMIDATLALQHLRCLIGHPILPLLVMQTPRYLNFSTCFSDTSPTCREHGTGFLER